MTALNPRIYVASLSDYNAGILHGAWIDLSSLDADTIHDEIEEMLAASPYMAETGEVAEEWAIHDYDGFGGLRVGEWSLMGGLVATAEMLLEDDGEMLAMWASHMGYEADDEAWHHEWEDVTVYRGYLEDVAEEIFFEIYDVPDHLAPYIDTDRFARDLDMDGYTEIGGYVFSPVH